MASPLPPRQLHHARPLLMLACFPTLAHLPIPSSLASPTQLAMDEPNSSWHDYSASTLAMEHCTTQGHVEGHCIGAWRRSNSLKEEREHGEGQHHVGADGGVHHGACLSWGELVSSSSVATPFSVCLPPFCHNKKLVNEKEEGQGQKRNKRIP